MFSSLLCWNRIQQQQQNHLWFSKWRRFPPQTLDQEGLLENAVRCFCLSRWGSLSRIGGQVGAFLCTPWEVNRVEQRPGASWCQSCDSTSHPEHLVGIRRFTTLVDSSKDPHCGRLGRPSHDGNLPPSLPNLLSLILTRKAKTSLFIFTPSHSAATTAFHWAQPA